MSELVLMRLMTKAGNVLISYVECTLRLSGVLFIAVFRIVIRIYVFITNIVKELNEVLCISLLTPVAELRGRMDLLHTSHMLCLSLFQCSDTTAMYLIIRCLSEHKYILFTYV